MLTTDMIRVRRRKGRIEVPPLKPAERARLLSAAGAFIEVMRQNPGERRGYITHLFDDVDHDPRDYKFLKGLRKLVTDRATFAPPEGVDPIALRADVFTRAAAMRRAAAAGEVLQPEDVYKESAAALSLNPEDIEPALFADLKENHRLTSFEELSPEALVDHYELSQRQAVLLRAVRVVVTLRGADPGAYRLFFRRLKFRRLLYTLEREADGSCRVHIDGPFSLFKAVTKYGLQLALILPALDEFGEWELDAEIRWGKERTVCDFHLEGKTSAPTTPEAVRLPDEVEALRGRFARLKTPWEVEIANELLDLPGVGLCVPDLMFTHRDTGARVCLEVMGYWSRDAVWKRVELVQAGLPQRVIFALSERLRVCESVLEGELPGQLYVYKGSMSAKVIAERLGE